MTNASGISRDTKLYKLGQKLFKSAFKYWCEYNKTQDYVPVVWVTAEDGTMVIYCHEMYGAKLLHIAEIINSEEYSQIHYKIFTGDSS